MVMLFLKSEKIYIRHLQKDTKYPQTMRKFNHHVLFSQLLWYTANVEFFEFLSVKFN